MRNFDDDYYKILKIPFTATSRAIETAYRICIKNFHLDGDSSENNFKKINIAYETLSNPSLREKYDQWYINTYINSTKKDCTQLNTQNFQVNIYNVDDNVCYTAILPVDIDKFPPSIYAVGNNFYAIEKREGNQVVCRMRTIDNWRAEINSYSKSPANSIISILKTIGVFFLKILEKAPTFVIFSIIALIITLSECASNSSSSKPTSENSSSVEDTLSGYIEEEKPAHGTSSHTYTENYRTSIFKIQLPKSDNKSYYYIKLVDASSGELIQDVFMNPGTNIEIVIPCGRFKLKYACGESWYGYEDTFGPYGSYSQSDDIFEFTYEYGNSVTLYPVPHGNLETESIDFSDF